MIYIFFYKTPCEVSNEYFVACILNGDNRSQKDYLRAVDYCDKVLQMDKNNEKAIYRKGMCLARANLHDKAIETLKLCPKSK
jgi:tetratricopeptide (TPR) repeat protein